MPASPVLPRHLRPRREKIFGEPTWSPLDRNAKARIIAFARGWNVNHKEDGQHRGPLTRAMMEVLEALLWGFHNAASGRCFPGLDTIAAKAECCRDTVCEALKVLERANILTWVNRIARIKTRELDLFGRMATRWRIIRTSNAYLFRDPLPCHAAQVNSSKSENPGGTQIQELSLSYELSTAPKQAAPALPTALDMALARLGNAMADKIEREGTRSAA